MTDKLLKKQMIETVENQIRLNEPKCTNETFTKLTSDGVDEETAKKMIAGVLLEEMYYILKSKEPFNEQRYEQKLGKLRAEIDTGDTVVYKDSTMEDLIRFIEYNNSFFPEEAIKEIISRKEEAIPHLLDILHKVLENPKSTADNVSYFAHIYAAYLLAQFRVADAYPVFVNILKLPGELPHDLFGDTICEAGDRILASICGNNIDPIKELILNEQADEFVRGQAVSALTILVFDGQRPRDEILEYYRTLLTEGIPDNNLYVMAEIISCCNNLYPEEVIEEIKIVFKKKLVDDSVIDLDFVKETLKNTKKDIIEFYKSDPHNQIIYDTVEELIHWACFNDDPEYEFEDEEYYDDDVDEITAQPVIKEFVAGRNDPCPCGSGKKYKKCCGR